MLISCTGITQCVIPHTQLLKSPRFWSHPHNKQCVVYQWSLYPNKLQCYDLSVTHEDGHHLKLPTIKTMIRYSNKCPLSPFNLTCKFLVIKWYFSSGVRVLGSGLREISGVVMAKRNCLTKRCNNDSLFSWSNSTI